jgi:hypothetical protein
MRVFGKDVTPEKVLGHVKERLLARGLLPPSESVARGVTNEAPVNPFAFIVEVLAENIDVTQPLPLETHRAGLSGALVLSAKRLFRKTGQLFINEALARQVKLNGHLLDGYALLSAEVERLRALVGVLEARMAEAPETASPSLIEKVPRPRATPIQPATSSRTSERPEVLAAEQTPSIPLDETRPQTRKQSRSAKGRNQPASSRTGRSSGGR